MLYIINEKKKNIFFKEYNKILNLVIELLNLANSSLKL